MTFARARRRSRKKAGRRPTNPAPAAVPNSRQATSPDDGIEPDSPSPPRVSERSDARSARPILYGLLLASFVLLTAWSFVVPIFESPDEPSHWQFARYVHDRHVLPLYGPLFVEANEPPLYYLLVALLAYDTPLPPHLAYVDGSGSLSVPFAPRLYENANGDLGRYWSLRVTRLATVVLSVLTVLFAYLAGREATGNPLTGLLTGALVAFLPQFTFRGMNVSADALVTMACAAEVYLLLRLIRRGYTCRVAVGAAAVLAAAFLSKSSAVSLIPAFALTMFFSATSLRVRLLRCCLLGFTLLLTLPWLLRNRVLYGDYLASNVMLRAVPGLVHKKALTDPYFTGQFLTWLPRSFVGVFGWMNVWLDERIYNAFALLGVLVVVGLALRLSTRRSDRIMLFILTSIPVANFVVVVDINLTFSQAQGRYLFPSLAAVGVLAALGLESLPGWTAQRRRLIPASAACLAVCNVAILIAVVKPAYWPGPIPGTPDRVVIPRLSSYHDVSYDPSSGSVLTVGPDPQLSFAVNVDSRQYSFLSFDIQGSIRGLQLIGGVYFAVDGGGESERQQVPFIWTADGSRRHIIVALRQNVRWRGRATTLRIDPINVHSEKYEHLRLQLTGVQMASSLPRQVA